MIGKRCRETADLQLKAASFFMDKQRLTMFFNIWR
jgi:hypothetical protein